MKDNIQFGLILCLFAYIIFLQQCGNGSSSQLPVSLRTDTTIVIDTIFPTPVIVNMPRQEVPRPTIVYVDTFKRQVPINTPVDTTKHFAVQLYQDSIQDENLTLFYSSLVDGELLQNNLKYKLKIPKLINKTVRIREPVPVPVSAFFLNAGVGGNPSQFASVTVGAQFISAKGWALGYDYDILQNVHSVKLGIRLFKFGKKSKK